MAAELSWGGLLRGGLVLAAIWWAWAAYSWLTNEVDCRRRIVRLVIFAAMICMLIASLAVPKAFEGDAVIFATAYLGVRVLHVGLFAAASDDLDVRAAARALAPTAVLAPALLLIASGLGDALQLATWIVALAIDYVGGARRGISGWRLSPGHFAERYSLIVIIAIGESIVAIGVGAGKTALGGSELLCAALGVVLAACLWSDYFDEDLERVEHQLAGLGRAERNALARDAFPFLHLPLVAGIVLVALGVKQTLAHTHADLEIVAGLALCGGTALFLLANAAFRHRVLRQRSPARLAAAAACLALTALAVSTPAYVTLLAVVAAAVTLVAFE